MRGKLITLEGPDGAGKSTICKIIENQYSNIMLVREPGSTLLGEKIRTLLKTENMPARAELMLFEAARACIVDEVIIPTIDSGVNVLCDRFYDSTTAYQGYGRGINIDDINFMNNMATKNLTPDLTILLDIDPKKSMTRKNEILDRIELAGIDFHVRIRNGFLEIAQQCPSRFRIVDASKSLQEVETEVFQILNELFAREQDA